MSLETNFNVSPYFDDYDEAKEFYKILFRPSVAVQVRELNQLQTILQNQIERFGSHVFKNGTIVSGVNFEYIPYYPFVKLKDTTTQDQPVDVETYSNYWVRNSSNLVAKVVNYETGVESQDPDLSTLYLKYLNSGTSNTSRNFANNDVLTVYDIDNPVFSITVYNGGLNFSNSDVVVFQSALSVNVTSGSFTNGETITQATTGAQAQIFEINTTAVASSTLLKVKPLTVDLSNTSANSVEWTFNTSYNITGGSSGAVANVVSLVGSGAVGSIVTDSLGVVQSVDVTSSGSEYLVSPFTTIKPLSAAATVSSLNLQSQNYLTQITVANSSMTAPVWGNGYAFAVTDGIIYQKGHFLKVDPQVIIVEKYSSSPNNVVVGFDTSETVVSSTGDTSLLDNSTGSLNYSAPGANRLKLTPTLVTKTKTESDANTSFLPLVEFVAGEPHKENRVTVYSTLGKEFERRTFESAGDYVIDPFTISTKDTVVSSTNTSPNNTHFKVVVDPGSGYIAGSRVQTLNNALIDVTKATTTQIKTNQLVTTSYGSYTIVKELVGSFNINAGSSVSLRDTAAAAATNTTSWGVTSPGSEIGTAKVRSFVYRSGSVGSPNCLYELYLFDIQMNAGKNFRDVRAIYYNGTGVADAVADCNLELDASLNANVAVLQQPSDRALVFDTGYAALKTVNNAVFQYVSTNESLTINSVGAVTISLSTTGESFPYTNSATLSSTQELDVTLVPTANLQATANIGGWVAVTNNQMVGTFTTFISDLRVGDYVKVANSTANQIFGIAGISNNTLATVTANAVSMNTIQANVMLFFPAFRPLNFSDRDTRVITNAANSTVLTATINTAISGTGTTILGNYKVRNSTSSEVTRSVYRDCLVKLNLSSHPASNSGPWCLGIPDAIRLKAVYYGNSSVSSSDSDLVKNFYIDNNQKSGFYGLSYLKMTNDSNLTLTTSDYLLVKFDVLQHSAPGGFKTVSSFNLDDTKTLEQSTNTINLLEIPEYGTMDLRNTIDFRPIVTATANVTNAAASVTTNPANTEALSSTNKYFPVPDSSFTYNTEYYLGRQDRVIINRSGDFVVLQGTPGTGVAPDLPAESLSLGEVVVPPYPSLGIMTSNTISKITTRHVGDSKGIKSSRKFKHAIITSNVDRINDLQPPQYTMKDIMHLEQRLYSLERKVSFTRIENEISKISIPSTIDPTVNRYINGFFVDSFTDDAKVDLQNREYAANLDVERGELQPSEMQINLQMQYRRTDATTNTSIIQNSLLMLPYSEYKLISQPQATSTVGCDGNMSQYVGDCVVYPESLPLEGMMTQSTLISLVDAPPTGGGGGVTHFGFFKKLFSDINLKQNIKLIGNKIGINIYTYNYIWDTEPVVGVMAQELLNTDYASAVSLHDTGYYQVDYSLLPELLLNEINLKTTAKYKH